MYGTREGRKTVLRGDKCILSENKKELGFEILMKTGKEFRMKKG